MSTLDREIGRAKDNALRIKTEVWAPDRTQDQEDLTLLNEEIARLERVVYLLENFARHQVDNAYGMYDKGQPTSVAFTLNNDINRIVGKPIAVR